MNINVLLNWILAVVYIIIVPLAFLFCVRRLAKDLHQTRHLRRSGVTVVGWVKAKRHSIFNRGRRYFVSFTFKVNPDEANSIVYSLEQEGNKKHYQRLEPSNAVQVRYLPDDPHISRLAGTDEDNTGRLAVIAFTLILGIA